MRKKGRRKPDPDIQGAARALRRSAARAREIARQTGTWVVVYKNGKIVKQMAEDP